MRSQYPLYHIVVIPSLGIADDGNLIELRSKYSKIFYNETNNLICRNKAKPATGTYFPGNGDDDGSFSLGTPHIKNPESGISFESYFSDN